MKLHYWHNFYFGYISSMLTLKIHTWNLIVALFYCLVILIWILTETFFCLSWNGWRIIFGLNWMRKWAYWQYKHTFLLNEVTPFKITRKPICTNDHHQTPKSLKARNRWNFSLNFVHEILLVGCCEGMLKITFLIFHLV